MIEDVSLDGAQRIQDNKIMDLQLKLVVSHQLAFADGK